MTVTVVEYGMGNIGSILNMLRKIGAPCEASADPNRIAEADKLILPGIGHFAAGMQRLRDSGLMDALNHTAKVRKAPVLGICLGMQLLTESSEEGGVAGLGWAPGRTVKFDFGGMDDRRLRVPHMGWNEAKPVKETALTKDVGEAPRYYFVHSYHVVCDRPEDRLFRTHYGRDFDSGLQHENIAGVQFHPEKSHRFGLQLLRNFAAC